MAMMRLSVIVLLAILVTMAQLAHGLPDDQSPESVKKWFENFHQAKPVLTLLRFYFHNNLTRDPPTAAPVAQANTTNTSPTNFGLVEAIDAPLTELPDSSETIGYSQGLFAFTSLEERSPLLVNTIAFIAGKYNGSTLSLLGLNPVRAAYREVPIIGGSGDFRMAEGMATLTTYFRNSTTRDAIIEISCSFHRYVID